ncbi:MAG: hypothetical protein SOT08_02485 [Candidatus Borkfalkiaceae bacterium]|nr:hypothetical protein [Christensenellaceae bacterium]
MPVYRIADVVFSAEHIYGYTPKLCEKYRYSGDVTPELHLKITPADIAAERENEGGEKFPDAYLESLALFRKLGDYILNHSDGMIFHASAVAVDGDAYLFTAPSGTGKSTHARLWKEMLGDRLVYINDDKPVIRRVNGDFYVYGTPWNGKHRLDTDAKAKIKAICKINQAKENAIREMSPAEMLMVVLNQTVRPTETEPLDKLLGLLDDMLKKVGLYSLDCNISREAAELSFGKMSGKRQV